MIARDPFRRLNQHSGDVVADRYPEDPVRPARFATRTPAAYASTARVRNWSRETTVRPWAMCANLDSPSLIPRKILEARVKIMFL